MVVASLLLIASAGAAAPNGGPCRVLVSAKSAGDIVAEGDTVLAVCPEKQITPLLKYDARSHSVIARQDIASGEPLGRVYFPATPAIRPGDKIRLTARIGQVAISRSAIALQFANEGMRFFAILDDGRIVAAPNVYGGVPGAEIRAS